MKRAILGSFFLIAALGTAVLASGPGGAFPYQHPSAYPATQTIGASGTIASDACGGLKRITATAARTTSTVYTIDTVNSGLKSGCVMDIVNVGTFVITLDANSSFFGEGANGASDVVLGTKHSVRVASLGSYWTILGSPANVAP